MQHIHRVSWPTYVTPPAFNLKWPLFKVTANRMSSILKHPLRYSFLKECTVQTCISFMVFSFYSLSLFHRQTCFLTRRFLSSSMVLKSWENSFKDWAAKEILHIKKCGSYLIYICRFNFLFSRSLGTFSSYLYWSHHQSQRLRYIQTESPAETERTAEQQEKDLRKNPRKNSFGHLK